MENQLFELTRNNNEV